jgi:hypothetical protein
MEVWSCHAESALQPSGLFENCCLNGIERQLPYRRYGQGFTLAVKVKLDHPPSAVDASREAGVGRPGQPAPIDSKPAAVAITDLHGSNSTLDGSNWRIDTLP